MSDNPRHVDAGAFALPFLRVIELAGRDAVAFAQSQFMNDVLRLGDGDWQWNGWLDPKGRVQALFALLRIDGETIWLVTAAVPAALVASLRRFVFRSKVTIAVSALHAHGVLASPGAALAGRSARVGGDVELDFGGDAGARTLRLSDDAAPDSTDGLARWLQLDIAHGWPALPGIALDAFTPQQLSLQRLEAFSVKKGCYPGQEIVARTHFLGRAKRGLARLRVAGARPGDPVHDDTGREVGQLVAVVAGEALAVVPLEPVAATLHHAGVAVERLPLADGLAR